MTTKQKKALRKILIAAAMIVVLLILENALHIPEKVMHWLLLIPYFVVGFDVLKKAGIGIIHGQILDENFLMTVATVAAIAIGENLESVAVMLFYQVGELFQSIAATRSRRNISELMDIRPDYANLITDGKSEKVDPDEVSVGSLLLVRPGEKVPIDGVVEEGTSSLNTAALTGESMPSDVKPGDQIISGCVNLTGTLTIRTTKEFEDSTVSRILELVENSGMKKAKTERFITRFARVYTPVVCILAIALAVGFPIVRFALGMDPEIKEAVIRACTFLVISCPCALVLSIPLSFFGGIGGAGARGILIKGGNDLEALSKVKTIVFDKTGTLTKGEFSVAEVLPAGDTTREQLLLTAVYGECHSYHPIARSIRASAGVEPDERKVRFSEEVPGEGIRTFVSGKHISVGNEKMMALLGIKDVLCPKNPGTKVHVALEKEYLGCILVSDQIKEGVAETIRDLKTLGVNHTVMLTGDNEETASYVAKTVGVDEVHASLLPADKVTCLEKILEERDPKDRVAYVGDGINDAPVLAESDVGIAMGAFGSDAAIEAADVVLMDDDPKNIALAMRLARKTLRIVYENIIFAIGVKVLFLLLGALGIVNMWGAIFADVGVMILAVVNAMRALRTKNV